MTRRLRIIGLLGALLAFHGFHGQAARAESGTVEARTGTAEPQGPVRGPLLSSPPAMSGPPGHRHEERDFSTPVDLRFSPDDAQPMSPPTDPDFVRPGAGGGPPEDFAFFRHHPLTDEETNNASGFVAEPSAGADGRVVFLSGNFFAAVSENNGATFSYISPSATFPPANDGFCCDQHVYYERTRGAWFWLLQYAENGTNTQRIAVANSQSDVVSNTWFWYDFTPESFGYPSSNYWLDFPDLTVSDKYLHLVTKIHRITPPFAAPTNIVCRIPLDEASQGLPITFGYVIVELQGVSCTDGATSSMYFAAHKSNTVLRVFEWPEGSGTVSWTDVAHAPYNTGPMMAFSPDGYNFAANVDDWIWAAWAANGKLGFMWPAAQGGGFPFPHVQVVRVSIVSFSLLSQEQIWSANTAWLYPAVHPNDQGYLGGTIAFGGGVNYPGSSAWIADDFNNQTIAPLENYVFAAGDAGPDENRWGDYYSARRHVPYGRTWIGTGTELQGGSSNDFSVVHYIWFGRERDRPPPRRLIHADWQNASGYEDGTFSHPYNTAQEGHFAASGGDTIQFRAGRYPEVLSFTTPLLVRSWEGIATIGR